MNDMKRVLSIILAIVIASSLYSQEVSKKDVIIQKTTPMLHLNGVAGYLNFYNGDVTIVHATNEININGGRLDANGGIGVGEDATKALISEINILGGEFYMLNTSGDTIPVRILSSQKIDGDTVYPNISHGTSAPSSTPAKIGDMYINTATDKLYIATGTSSSSDWIITN